MTFRRLQRFITFLGHHSDAMPCDNPDDEIDQIKLPNPKLWAKKGRAKTNSDGEEEEDTDGDSTIEIRRKWNGKAEYVTIKKWVTGECAVMEDSDIMTELNDLAREFMERSRLRRLPNHKSNPTDIGLWNLLDLNLKRNRGLRTKCIDVLCITDAAAMPLSELSTERILLVSSAAELTMRIVTLMTRVFI